MNEQVNMQRESRSMLRVECVSGVVVNVMNKQQKYELYVGECLLSTRHSRSSNSNE